MSDNIISLTGNNLVHPETVPRLLGNASVQKAIGEYIVKESEEPPFMQLIAMGIHSDGSLYLATDNNNVADQLLLIKRIERHIMETFFHSEVFG